MAGLDLITYGWNVMTAGWTLSSSLRSTSIAPFPGTDMQAIKFSVNVNDQHRSEAYIERTPIEMVLRGTLRTWL